MDYLVFARLPLVINNLKSRYSIYNLKSRQSIYNLRSRFFNDVSVALVRHHGSPAPGTEICVAPDTPAVPQILLATMLHLGLTAEDLLWVHPEYMQEVKTNFAQYTSRGSNPR